MLISPEWPVPGNVRAVSTTRIGGYSSAPFDSFNLGNHVGDNPDAVKLNRQLLVEAAGLPSEPYWLNQVHSTDTILLGSKSVSKPSEPITADGSVTLEPGYVCAVMTADCLPVLLTNLEGTKVAAIHAGWRGLANGIIETLVNQWFKHEAFLAWLGPAISQSRFEIGSEVKDLFIRHDDAVAEFFQQSKNKYNADLVGIAKSKLTRLGGAVYGGDFCSFSDEKRFFSYRRDSTTGRMATLIWMEKNE